MTNRGALLKDAEDLAVDRGAEFHPAALGRQGGVRVRADQGGTGEVELEDRDALGELGGANFLGADLLADLGCVEFILRRAADFAGLGDAGEHARGQFVLLAGSSQSRLGLVDGGLGRLDAGLGLGLLADVEEGGVARFDHRQDGLVGGDGMTGLELNAQEHPTQRGGDDVALANARLPLLVDGDAHRPLDHGAEVDLHRARPEAVDDRTQDECHQDHER